MEAERQIERILEMSFDHTTAMISLLNQLADDYKVTAPCQTAISSARRTLRGNIDNLQIDLQRTKLMLGGGRIETFEHKCQEFGI